MEPAATPRVFVVAGMHRAGTSVAARALPALGISLGDHLMSADPRMNARGFFEDVEVVDLDDRILESVDADWKNVALLAGRDWTGEAFAWARAEARALLAARLGHSGRFGFKDPRVPRLLPLWQATFADAGIADAYVIAVRHPLSVMASLTARDGLDVRRSGWLWLTHLVCALRYTAGRPRVIVDYDRLVGQPEQELLRMARGLSLPAPGVDAVKVYCDAFISAELRHVEHPPEALAPGTVPPLVPAAHALAQRLARDEAEPNEAATLAEVDRLVAALSEFEPLLAYAGTIERQADQAPRLSGELAWARSSLADATDYAAELRAQLTTAQTYVDDLVPTLQRKESELVAAHDKLKRVGDDLLGRIVLRRIER